MALDWIGGMIVCSEEGRQTVEGGEEESEADGRQQPGGSIVPHRYDVDFHLFLVPVCVFEADSEPRESSAPRFVCSLNVPAMCYLSDQRLFVCLFICLSWRRVYVCE